MAAKPEAKPGSADAPKPASTGAWAGVRSGAIGDADGLSCSGLPSPDLSCCDLSSSDLSRASVICEASSAPGEGWG